MGVVTSREFRELCRAGGVKLGPDVNQRLIDTHTIPLAEVVAGVAYDLWYKKPKPLASESIELPPDMEDDTSAQTMAEIINGSITPKPDGNALTFNGRRPPDVLIACDSAERYFLETFAALGKVSRKGRVAEWGAQIITHKMAPVIIRKCSLEESGIILDEVIINGIRYPAGSIVGLRLRGDSGRKHAVLEHKVELHPVENVERIRFRRLSGFAFSRAERRELSKVVGSGVKYATPWRKRQYGKITMDNIREVAFKATTKLDLQN